MRLINADALKLAIVEEGQKSKRYKIGEFWELNRDEIWNAIDAQPTIEERKKYTDKELEIFARGISLFLLSKKSAQSWNYSEKTAKELEFLEQLYEKVKADMRGEEDEGA